MDTDQDNLRQELLYAVARFMSIGLDFLFTMACAHSRAATTTVMHTQSTNVKLLSLHVYCLHVYITVCTALRSTHLSARPTEC